MLKMKRDEFVLAFVKDPPLEAVEVVYNNKLIGTWLPSMLKAKREAKTAGITPWPKPSQRK